MTFVTDTAGSRVPDLASELSHGLTPFMASRLPDFPVAVGVAFRCLPDSYGRRTFRRLADRRDLTLDIAVSLERYETMPMNEQRETLGNTFHDYLTGSLRNYPKVVSAEAAAACVEAVHAWMTANGWIDGVATKSRQLIETGVGLSEVADQLELPLAEVEYYEQTCGITHETVHPDNT